jgi:hypothetical protein
MATCAKIVLKDMSRKAAPPGAHNVNVLAINGWLGLFGAPRTGEEDIERRIFVNRMAKLDRNTFAQMPALDMRGFTTVIDGFFSGNYGHLCSGACCRWLKFWRSCSCCCGGIADLPCEAVTPAFQATLISAPQDRKISAFEGFIGTRVPGNTLNTAWNSLTSAQHAPIFGETTQATLDILAQEWNVIGRLHPTAPTPAAAGAAFVAIQNEITVYHRMPIIIFEKTDNSAVVHACVAFAASPNNVRLYNPWGNQHCAFQILHYGITHNWPINIDGGVGNWRIREYVTFDY